MTDGEALREIHTDLRIIRESQIKTEGRIVLIEDGLKRRPDGPTIKKWIHKALSKKNIEAESGATKKMKLNPALVRTAQFIGAAVVGGALAFFGS
jgi:hypothetical protein